MIRPRTRGTALAVREGMPGSDRRPKESRAPRAAKPKHPGEGLDRSTEGVIAADRDLLKPAPPNALPDRHTTDSRRRG